MVLRAAGRHFYRFRLLSAGAQPCRGPCQSCPAGDNQTGNKPAAIAGVLRLKTMARPGPPSGSALADSPVERGGFEPLVACKRDNAFRGCRCSATPTQRRDRLRLDRDREFESVLLRQRVRLSWEPAPRVFARVCPRPARRIEHLASRHSDRIRRGRPDRSRGEVHTASVGNARGVVPL